jgi:glutaredoxin-related protein
MRPILPREQLTDTAMKAMSSFHSHIVNEVQDVVRSNKVVVIGMAQNPYVRKARKLLAEKAVTFRYLEYGNYLSMWKPRLAIKIWSGWPTFPQIFIDGRLVGGYTELVEYLKNNRVQ